MGFCSGRGRAPVSEEQMQGWRQGFCKTIVNAKSGEGAWAPGCRHSELHKGGRPGSSLVLLPPA